MSLNLWSVVLFSAHMFFYLAMIFSIATNSSLGKIVLMISGWVTYQIATLWYGIATHQIGFILMFAFQIVASIAAFIVGTERTSGHENS